MIRLCANGSAWSAIHNLAVPADAGQPSDDGAQVASAVRDEVVQLLARQGGVARRRDVLRAGLTRRQLARLVRQGQLRLLTPHLVTNVDAPGPDEALVVAAVALQATVSHEHAALMWGMELATDVPGPTVTVGRDRSRAAHEGTTVRRADLADDERVERNGVWVTTPLRTVLDLCRTLPLHEAVAVADSALRRRLVTVGALRSALCRLPAGIGRQRVARVLALIDHRSGSVLESLARVLLAQAGLGPAETQLVVRTAAGTWIGRVDFAWPAARLVVEVDGFAFHSDRGAYRADRRRGNALVLAGWRVLRFSWEDVVLHPEEVVAAVREALADRSRLHTA